MRRVALGNIRFPGLQHFDIGGLAQQIRRHFQFNRAGAAFLETHKGFHKVVGDGFNLPDARVPVGNGGEHSELIFGFVGCHLAAADEFGFDVGGNLQDGRCGEVGFAHGAYGVGGAGPGAGEQDAGLAGSAGVAVGHIAAAEFQPPADKADIVLAVKQGVKEVKGMH